MKIDRLLKPFTLLPNFKGKVRFLRFLFNMFVPDEMHIIAETRLIRPLQYNMRLDLHCKHELMAFLMGGYEADTVSFLSSVFDKQGYFLDIGANIGLISIPFAKSITWQEDLNYGNPFVYAVEAIKSNYDSLLYNINANQLSSCIKPLFFGLGEKDKVVEITVEGNLKTGEGSGTANIVAAGSEHLCERIPLDVTTIDKLINNAVIPDNCSLMKIDTDGYDLFVLMGAKKIIEEARPIIFGEFMAHCMNWHGQSVDHVIDFMKDYNYRIFEKHRKQWIFYENFNKKEFVSDLLLVPSEKVNLYNSILFD